MPAAALSARLANGGSVSTTLAISPRAWQIENVAVGGRAGALPSEEYAPRRAIELAQIRAARSLTSGSWGWRQNFAWPAIGRISGRFGAQRIYRGQLGVYHSGIDISTGLAGSPLWPPPTEW